MLKFQRYSVTVLLRNLRTRREGWKNMGHFLDMGIRDFCPVVGGLKLERGRKGSNSRKVFPKIQSLLTFPQVTSSRTI